MARPFTFTVSRTGSTSADATVAYAVTGFRHQSRQRGRLRRHVGTGGHRHLCDWRGNQDAGHQCCRRCDGGVGQRVHRCALQPLGGLTLGSSTANGTILNDDLKSHDDAYIIRAGQVADGAAITGVLSNARPPPVTAALVGRRILWGKGQLSPPMAAFLGRRATSPGSTASAITPPERTGGDGRALIYVVPVRNGRGDDDAHLLGLNAEEQIALDSAPSWRGLGRGSPVLGQPIQHQPADAGSCPVRQHRELVRRIRKGPKASSVAVSSTIPFGCDGRPDQHRPRQRLQPVQSSVRRSLGLAYWTPIKQMP